MKKVIKNPIFMFILGIIISGVTAYAVSYNANQIDFKPSNPAWDASKVDKALDDLYGLKNINVSTLPTFSNSEYTSTRNTTNTVTLSNLNRGEYICTSYYAASSTEGSSTRGDTTAVSYTINGCSEQNVFNNHGHWNAASRAVTGSMYTSVMSRGINYYCKVNDDDTTISVVYGTTYLNTCSVSMQISCTKIK